MKAKPKILIAGSRAIAKTNAARALVSLLVKLPLDATILLRGRARGLPGQFERDIATMAEIIGLPREWRVPVFEEDENTVTFDRAMSVTRTGRELTFDRDMAMVTDADLVICIVTPDEAIGGDSGTYSLSQKALSVDTPVYLYTMVDDTHLVRIGEEDSGDQWATLVP